MCVHVALLIHHATRIRYYVTSSVAPLALPYFSTSHKRHDFREGGVTKHKTRVLIFSTTFVYTASHFKKNLVRYCHKCRNTSTCKVPVILLGF